MKKAALFAFNGDPMCFIHVLLNALDMQEKGWEVKVVLEGAATKLIPDLTRPGSAVAELYQKAKSLGLLDGACKACSIKMGTLESAKKEGLQLLDEMKGHASMARFLQKGFEVISF